MREIKFRAMKEGKWLRFNGIFNDTPVRFDVETLGQYTGLKDKKGKDVYEGDIVKTQWGGIGRVERMDGAFWYFFEDGKHEVRCNGYETHARLIEIIGNIYENPDLLSDEK